MQNSRISHRAENGWKAGYPPMQKPDAFGERIRWQVYQDAAPKAARALSSPFRTFPNGGEALRRNRAFLRVSAPPIPRFHVIDTPAAYA